MHREERIRLEEQKKKISEENNRKKEQRLKINEEKDKKKLKNNIVRTLSADPQYKTGDYTVDDLRLDTTMVKKSVFVPPSLRKLVVGKQGKFLQDLKTNHKVIVKVPDDNNKEDPVIIIGEEKGVTDAIPAIEQKLAGFQELQLPLHPKQRKYLIGKGGERDCEKSPFEA